MPIAVIIIIFVYSLKSAYIYWFKTKQKTWNIITNGSTLLLVRHYRNVFTIDQYRSNDIYSRTRSHIMVLKVRGLYNI